MAGGSSVHRTSGPDAIAGLGAGETEAITLAVELHADLLLMDDRRGVEAARAAGRPKPRWHGIVNLAEAFDRIKQTTFRYPQGVMDQYPDENAGKAQN